MSKRIFSRLFWSLPVVSIIFSNPAYSESGLLQQIKTTPTTHKQKVLAQSPTTSISEVVSVIEVKVNAIDKSLEIILVTQEGEKLEISADIEGNSYIVDIIKAQLQLPNGNSFRQEKPAAGILLIEAINLDADRIRLTVTGEAIAPTVKVFNSPDRGLVFDVTQESTSEAMDESEIEIVVTAEKTEENVQNVPISITVLTDGDIEDGDVTSLSDISGNTPNFSTFTPGRNFVLYSIRGLSNFNFLSRDPVAFYVDDVPYDYTGFLDLDLSDLERVEVLRGPQSTLYGRNATSGVVNIITRKPTNDFQFNATAGYGNYNHFDFRAGVGGPLVEDKLFFRLSGSYEARDGYLKNTFLNSDVDEESGGTGRAQLLWTPSLDWEIALNAAFDVYRGGVPLNLFGADPFRVEQDYDGFNDLDSNTQSLKIAYNNPNLRITSVTSRRFSDQNFESEADITTADILRQAVAIDSTILSQEIRIQSPVDTQKFEWLLGGYFESRDFNVGADSFRYGIDAPTAFGIDPGQDLITAEINEITLAFFTQVSYRPIDSLTLTAGLRYESFNAFLENRERIFIPADGSSPSPGGQSFNNIEKDGDIVLPRFVVEYRFNPDVMLYGTIARGYRPPGVNYRAENEGLLTFEAEKSWNYEVGLKSSWLDNRLITNLAVFHNPVDDYQVAVPDATGFFRDVTNAQVSITGLEFEVKATPVDGLNLIAGFGFSDAEFIEYTNPFTGVNFNGNKLPYAPNFTYNLALQYRAPIGIFARVEVQGLGTTFFSEANDFQQGSFALLNARLGYEFNNYGIYLFANNITNVEHLITAAAFPGFGTFVTYGAPVTYGFQLRARF